MLTFHTAARVVGTSNKRRLSSKRGKRIGGNTVFIRVSVGCGTINFSGGTESGKTADGGTGRAATSRPRSADGSADVWRADASVIPTCRSARHDWSQRDQFHLVDFHTSDGVAGRKNGSTGITSSCSRNAAQTRKNSAFDSTRRMSCRNFPSGSTPAAM